jgi:hypothetical protein
LSSKLRGFQASPLAPEDFIKYYLHKDKATPTDPIQARQERAAFNLFVDIAFENGPKLAKHLPILLQNAIILYGPTRTQQVQSKSNRKTLEIVS